ncbi:MAG: class I SAM-dependent methyltransferase [Alphaproteobacteria bacterium]
MADNIAYFNACAAEFDGESARNAAYYLDLTNQHAGMIPPRGKNSLLDVGCGPGHLLAQFKKTHTNWDVYGLDGSEQMLALCKEKTIPGLSLSKINLEKNRLSFPDGKFDLVISYATLEYINTACAVISDMLRVTKPGGRVLFSCLLNGEEGESPFESTEGDFPDKAIFNPASYSYPEQMIYDAVYPARQIRAKKYDTLAFPNLEDSRHSLFELIK